MTTTQGLSGLTIVVGKTYRNGHGDLCGPMEESRTGIFSDQHNRLYYPDGRTWSYTADSAANLILPSPTGTGSETVNPNGLVSLINEVLRAGEASLCDPGPEAVLSETRWYARARLVLDGGKYLAPGSTDELDPLIAAERKTGAWDAEGETSGRFRKTTTVEAWQLGSKTPRPAWAKWDYGNGQDYAVIVTLEGKMRAERNDWIIRGVKGELYPCKPDIFAATYVPVSVAALRTQQAPATGEAALRKLLDEALYSIATDDYETQKIVASDIKYALAASPASWELDPRTIEACVKMLEQRELEWLHAERTSEAIDAAYCSKVRAMEDREAAAAIRAFVTGQVLEEPQKTWNAGWCAGIETAANLVQNWGPKDFSAPLDPTTVKLAIATELRALSALPASTEADVKKMREVLMQIRARAKFEQEQPTGMHMTCLSLIERGADEGLATSPMPGRTKP